MSMTRDRMDMLIAATRTGIVSYAQTNRAHDRLEEALDEVFADRELFATRVVELEKELIALIQDADLDQDVYGFSPARHALINRIHVVLAKNLCAR